MMGGMRLDLPNISTGLAQPDFANQPPHPQHHMQPPPGDPSPQGPNPEAEVARIYGLLNELLEQLNANRQASIQLHSLAAGVKVRIAVPLYPCASSVLLRCRVNLFIRKQAMC